MTGAFALTCRLGPLVMSNATRMQKIKVPFMVCVLLRIIFLPRNPTSVISEFLNLYMMVFLRSFAVVSYLIR
jgi:hypothetical protein